MRCNYNKLEISKGFQQLEAWTDGKELIVLGEAPDEEFDPECKFHDCDIMGCSSAGLHVLGRFKVDWKWLIDKEEK